MSTVHPHQVLDLLTSSKMAALGSDRTEVRSSRATIALLLAYQLCEPGTYILFIEGGLVSKVAGITHAPVLLGLAFYACAALLLPLMMLLAFRPSLLGLKTPRKLATLAGLGGAGLWGLLSFMAADLDFEGGWLTVVFAIRAFVDLGLALLFALSLNAQHAREEIARRRRAEEDERDEQKRR